MDPEIISAPQFIAVFIDTEREARQFIEQSDLPVDQLRIKVLGSKSDFVKLTRQIRSVSKENRGQVGAAANQVKANIEKALREKLKDLPNSNEEWVDVTMPGTRPPQGHLHIVTQAIGEITRIFERLGFTRVRYPEVDWDWYAFESLNMPPDHPARDEWETFFIEYPDVQSQYTSDVKRVRTSEVRKKQQIVLTPHTSNGQVREMEKKKLPIRMINIAKCYRRQSDVSHVPMFHQFEGLYIDHNVSIGHLKGVLDYFVKQYFGSGRKSRIRPFHFQFTEPSFEFDISCGVCGGSGCKLCKEGWLEIGGAGMVHPVVLKNGGVDTTKWNGFAFGWGVERVAMMKAGTKLDDIRLLYSNDVRFLEQF